MTLFAPVDHLKVEHNYSGDNWQDFTGDLTGVTITLREAATHSASLSFYNAAMDPSQGSGTRVIKKGDKVRVHMHKGDGSTYRKTATFFVRGAPKVDIDLTQPSGRQNKVSVHLLSIGAMGVAGVA